MKKTISLSLAVMLTASALTACSSDAKVAGTGSPQPSGNVKKAPVKFSLLYPTTVSTGYHTRVPDLNKDKWVLKLEELTNTDLDVKVVEDAKFGVMFASNDIPDVVGSIGGPGSKSMSGSVENGVFMPLDELLKQYGPNLLKVVPKAAWDSVSYEGKIYG
ncbi:ABC transporter substrate-binding protein, partial [Paenibacillus sp. TAF58]